MSANSPQSYLRYIAPGDIDRNEDNPRLFFRSDELATLMSSIKQYGIQVPITVFAAGQRYHLIDGERRWRCADKLNLKRIPAIVQPEPSRLNNLLLMFNIHALREQWDYLTIANKLPEVIERFKDENGRAPNETELSSMTGLSRGQIRRCSFLLELPPKYKKQLLDELAKPKAEQQLSEDFFIEMERALKTVQNRVPEAVIDLDRARDALIEKFRRDVIGNITDFRKLSKIATSIANLGVKQTDAKAAIRLILTPNNNESIEKVYAEHFELRYDERKIVLNLRAITDFLEAASKDKDIALGKQVIGQLRRLRTLISKII